MEDVDMVRWTHEEADSTPARVEFDNYGGTYHSVFPAWVPAEWDDERVRNAIWELVPGERCEHSYDCCGRYYGGRGKVLGSTYFDSETKIVWVQRTYVQNV